MRHRMALRDLDIRRALRSHLEQLHGHDPETLIIDEMGLCQGTARIDVAVINGAITGYEIKSDRDSLDRIPAQARIYSQVFSHVAVVVSNRHLSRLNAQVPGWWGIVAARGDNEVVILENVRAPSPIQN